MEWKLDGWMMKEGREWLGGEEKNLSHDVVLRRLLLLLAATTRSVRQTNTRVRMRVYSPKQSWSDRNKDRGNIKRAARESIRQTLAHAEIGCECLKWTENSHQAA
jgi:hypothetical protein